MSSQVARHYDEHLGPIYAWMAGDFETAARRFEAWFSRHGVRPFHSRLAIDLGCGHGLQSVPLARLGFRVVAIDTCQHLLTALAANATGPEIVAVRADMLDFPNHVSRPADAIVCMGDTITHLASLDEVARLIERVAASLVPGGSFCTSFRDYTGPDLTGTARFIPVRSDPSRIHTCFLEYQQHCVRVHDLIHTLQDGGWSLAVSAYEKIRLAPRWLRDLAESVGLRLHGESSDKGMDCFAFVRE